MNAPVVVSSRDKRAAEQRHSVGRSFFAPLVPTLAAPSGIAIFHRSLVGVLCVLAITSAAVWRFGHGDTALWEWTGRPPKSNAAAWDVLIHNRGVLINHFPEYFNQCSFGQQLEYREHIQLRG